MEVKFCFVVTKKISRLTPRAHLSVSRYGVQQPCVQFDIVLGQRPVLVIVDEVEHRGEGQRLRETSPPSFVEDLDQSVGAVFPARVGTGGTQS